MRAYSGCNCFPSRLRQKVLPWAYIELIMLKVVFCSSHRMACFLFSQSVCRFPEKNLILFLFMNLSTYKFLKSKLLLWKEQLALEILTFFVLPLNCFLVFFVFDVLILCFFFMFFKFFRYKIFNLGNYLDSFLRFFDVNLLDKF